MVNCVGDWNEGSCRSECRKTGIFAVSTPASGDGIVCQFADEETRDVSCTNGECVAAVIEINSGKKAEITISSEVELSMTEEVWVDSGEDAFIYSMSSLLDVTEEDITIISATAFAGDEDPETGERRFTRR